MAENKKLITAVPSEGDKGKETRPQRTDAPSKGDKQTTKAPFPAERNSGEIISAPKKKGTVLGG